MFIESLAVVAEKSTRGHSVVIGAFPHALFPAKLFDTQIELDTCIKSNFVAHFENDELILHAQGIIQTLRLDSKDPNWPVVSNATIHEVIDNDGTLITSKTWSVKDTKTQQFKTHPVRKPSDRRKLENGTCVTIIGPILEYNPSKKEFTVQIETQDYCPTPPEKKRKTVVSTSIKKFRTTPPKTPPQKSI